MKKETLSLATAFTLTFLLIIALYIGVVKVTDISAAVAGFLVAGIFGVLWWGFKSKIEHESGENKKLGKKRRRVDPGFSYLMVYYSDRKDSPDSTKPHRPYYIVNSKNTQSKQAYWVSDLIEDSVRKHTFSFCTFDGEPALRAYFKEQDIHNNERFVTSGEELGLGFRSDGSLYGKLKKMDPELLRRFKDNKQKFYDFKLALIYTWGKPEVYPPRKRLLIKISTKEAFEPPIIDLELYDNDILSGENYSRLPHEPYFIWCLRHRNQIKVFHRWRYPIEKELNP